MGSASKIYLKCPTLPLTVPSSVHGLLWPPSCLLLQLPKFCTQHLEGLENANQLIILVMSKTLTTAHKAHLQPLCPGPLTSSAFWGDQTHPISEPRPLPLPHLLVSAEAPP